jgi:putative FmdB family regulatory protein
MPTYEYTCSSCGTNHEIVQSMSDPTLTVCPSCGQESLRKLFSGVGVVFKGSGFYRTDSRKSDSSSGTNSSGSSSPSTGSSDSSATGSKPSTTPSPSSPSTSTGSSSGSSSTGNSSS